MPEIVQEIGSYAGLASVLGLAVLSVLYFAQARDVKRLREWAGRAPERAEQATAPVPGRAGAAPQAQAPAAARPAAPPVPGRAAPGVPAAQAAAAGARPASASAAAQAPPRAGEAAPGGQAPRPGQPAAAPAGQGASSGSGQPAAAPAGQGASSGSGQPAAAPAGQGSSGSGQPAAAPGQRAARSGPASTPAGQGPPEPPQPAGAPGGQGSARPGGQPAAAGASPAGANAQGGAQAPPRPGAPAGGNAKPPAAPQAPRPGAPATPAAQRPGAPATPAAGRPGASPPVPAAAAQGPGRPLRPSPQETAIIAPPHEEPWYKRLVASPRYLVLAIAGVLILGGAAAFGVTQLTSDDSGSPAGDEQSVAPGDEDRQPADNPPRKRRGGGAVQPGSVTVAVLNGTTVPGLAATLSDEVGAAGFKVGTITNFSDQQLAESVVQYAPGHEREAAVVSRRLGIPQREAANPSSQGLAGDATVIVIAGADKAP